jgi:multiple sugar transport system ATP-binding protein
MARVVLENLGKRFKGTVRAVQNVSLTVEDRELLALVGPSGSGKTTTLRLIAGLERPDAGTISIDGKVINHVSPKDRDVAMVFQNHALYPHLTVFGNLALGLKLRKVSKAETEQRVCETAATLGLTDCLDRLPRELSGGERQRVAVGRAIVRRPKLFLFDEPLSNLDAPLRAQMRREIAQLHRRLGTTMIYVTHDQVEAMALGRRIAVMKDGAIQQLGLPTEVYHHPVNLFVAGFIGSPPMSFVRGTIVPKEKALFFQEQGERGQNATLAIRLDDNVASTLAGFAGEQIILGVRPEDAVETLAAGNHDRLGRIEGTIELVEPLGAETWVHLNTGSHAFVGRAAADSRVESGQRIVLTFPLRNAHFFDPKTESVVR